MEQTFEYRREEHRAHLIIYHIIWCPRRRRPVLVGPIAGRCQALIEQTCEEREWEILALAIQPDHLHLFVRVTPSDSAAKVVKECKGITSFHLRQEFAQLMKMPSIWTRSYLSSTAGNVSQQTSQRYIDAQSRSV
jgi:putative transposase